MSQSSSTACGTCGAPFDPSAAELDENGRPICRACVDRAALVEGEKRSTAALSGAAMTAASLGLLSIFCFGLNTAVPAIVVGSGALVAARTADRLAPGSVATSTYLAAGFGVFVGVMRLLAFGLVFS